MTQDTTYSVDSQFILDAHKAACSDWKAKLEAKFPEVFPVKYTIGQIINFKSIDGSDYIIAQIDVGTVSLIGLDSGNRYTGSIKVGNVYAITKTEIYKLIGASYIDTITIVSR